MSDKIKVLVVDDASFMVKALRDILEKDPEIEVVGSAKHGQEALEKIPLLKPDVITLDVDMPVMDGVKAIRHIMIESPVPIVMLSSLFSHGDITFEALRLGVVDFLPKPSGAISMDIHEQGNQIVERVKIAAAERIENVHRVKLDKIDARERIIERYGFRELDQIITIGTTLGGPNTIIQLMSELSSDIPAAVVATQEIAPNILSAFAKEFNEYTPWKVEAAEDGMPLEAGSCYICSYQEPMIVTIDEHQTPCLKLHTDSIKPLNALFSSAAGVFSHNTIGVLLTGIGDDGHEGFTDIKKNLGTTIAQDTETCVYPNLTQYAIEQGVVDFIANRNKLAEQIELAVTSRSADDTAAIS